MTKKKAESSSLLYAVANRLAAKNKKKKHKEVFDNKDAEISKPRKK